MQKQIPRHFTNGTNPNPNSIKKLYRSMKKRICRTFTNSTNMAIDRRMQNGHHRVKNRRVKQSPPRAK